MLSSKAQAGITVLIIFIALIIVAAVAAGVFIQTSSTLQQRALLVGDQAKDRVSSGIDIVEIVARGNLTERKVYGFDITARLLASSEGVKYDSTILRITTRNISYTASYLSQLSDNFVNDSNVIGTTQPWSVTNIDPESTENSLLSYTQATNLFTLTPPDSGVIVTNYSEADSDGYVALYNGTLDQTFGYAYIAGSRVDFVDAPATCTWENQTRGYKYCVTVNQGDSDAIIEVGEVITFHIRLPEPYAIREGEDAEVQFISRNAALRSHRVVMPFVMPYDEFVVWP